ncbi:hypothetical protein LPB140_06740 [Sphingorhabdus lutea]|uniref:TonB-dependent receptor n=1 Tax=Sphingorhabdus lutea TaxID=1913578 RepID=A0A1L3JBN2_9SPHN|nr:TonB-dependent receptor [Sphingorhabdus lutea]APG62530.1 hypothetical protein LPB140_06740 [Sphingorhabdus lutea]
MQKSIIYSISAIAMGSALIFPAHASETEAERGNEIVFADLRINVIGKLYDVEGISTHSVEEIDVSQDGLEKNLSQIAGLQQFRRSDARSAHPTSQGITMRGLGGNASSRTLLILDDVPQADPFGGWVAWPGYDAVNLGRIKILKGAGLVSMGQGAIAGAVELESLQERDHIEASLSYGNENSINAKASLSQKGFSVSGSYARGDGFVPINKSSRGLIDRGAKYEQAGIAIRQVAPLSDKVELQANMRAFTDNRDRGFQFSDNENSGVDASIRLVDKFSDWQWSALSYVQIRDFSTRFGSVGAGRNSVNLVLDQYNVPSTGLGAKFEIRPPLNDNAQLRIGAEWRRTIGETKENFFFTGLTPARNRNAGGQSDVFGAFVEGNVNVTDALLISIGGRADHWSMNNGFRKEINIADGSIRNDEIFADRSGWAGTARAGLAYDVTYDLKFRASAYTGWRLPTLNELYRPFRVGADATAANEALRPEYVKGAELGLDYERDNFSVSGTIFTNKLDNAIANVTISNGPGNFPGVGFVSGAGVYRQRQNLKATQSNGLEMKAAYNFNNVSLSANYAYVDAEIEAVGQSAALDGLRPAQVPKHFANAQMEYDGNKIGASINIKYLGNQFDDDQNLDLLKDALSVDAAIKINLSNNLRLEFSGENLFNKEIQAAYLGGGVFEIATPRSYWMTIRLGGIKYDK